MAGSLVGCGCAEGFAVASGGTLRMQVRSLRPLPSLCGLPSRNNCRFPLSPSLDNALSSKRNVEVRVAADYSDSKPESYKRQGKLGYHPLEELSKVEKEKIEHAGGGKLTNAEVARTLAEVNWSAFIFSTLVSDKESVLGTEVQYLVDDHGDVYFEIENDNEFLRNLSENEIYTFLVGFGNVDGLQFSEVIEAEIEEVDGESDSEDSSDESDDVDVQIYWEGVDESDDLDNTREESFGSLGGWSGFDSLDQVHPMDFASKVSECASTDYLTEMDNSERRLTITGVARPVTGDEAAYVQGVWYDRFLLSGGDDDGDDDEGEEEKDGHGDNGKVLPRIRTKYTLKDGGLDMEDQAESGKAVFSQNGTVVSKSSSGTGKSTKEQNLESQTTHLDTSDLSSSEYSVHELPSTSGNKAEEGDNVGDGHIEGTDGEKGGIVSREVGKRKRRNMKRGSLLDSSDMKEEAFELEEAAEIVLPPGATLEGDAVVGEWTEHRRLEIGSCFYKLEIISIQLDAGNGMEVPIEAQDFAFAEPDVLAHISSAIMERINSGGKKMESAMKALCQRAKGLNVEEVSLVGVDCLGLDLRVQCGIEVQTIRVPYSRRATSEATAEKLIDSLLFPRQGPRRPKKRSQDWKNH